ncbi:LytR cell envelope-related transcriptional attenuator [Arthrobacter sp. 9AX]|uniref:LytR C-terminal domain-containing protein n=1 Tax=Arthrobacter sp. 9AX TaxID=2653131 RepID=UPI0012F2362E|nr:LytR C-terminal domain-containing protein [Arthrobacter sp. 9AX]VXC43359.1 LytR cell envelope-related transcriptional attenuator [Arthrobacter sp. 9AX]
MTRYARDEFDKVPESASRQGVHRTASAPASVRLWPILAVGIAALAIGLVSFLILPKLAFNTAGNQASVSQEAAPLATTGSTPSATPDATPSTTTQPSASTAPEASAEAEPAPASTAISPARINKAQAVAVYNATGMGGLAGRVGGTVQADGWMLGQVGNWAGAPQQTSTIFYSGAGQLASAQALAELLGIPTLVNSTEFQVPLVVVLGPGYR